MRVRGKTGKQRGKERKRETIKGKREKEKKEVGTNGYRERNSCRKTAGERQRKRKKIR